MTDGGTVVHFALVVHIHNALALEWVGDLPSWLRGVLGHIELIGVDRGVDWALVGVLRDSYDVLV